MQTIKYEYLHPNYGWVDAGAECDAKTLNLLLGWPVRMANSKKQLSSIDFDYLQWLKKIGFEPFRVCVDKKGTFYEIISNPRLENKKWYVDCRDPGETGSYIFECVQDVRAIHCEMVICCPSSDPTGLAKTDGINCTYKFIRLLDYPGLAHIRLEIPKW
jgi:hypothetical protein